MSNIIGVFFLILTMTMSCSSLYAIQCLQINVAENNNDYDTVIFIFLLLITAVSLFFVCFLRIKIRKSVFQLKNAYKELELAIDSGDISVWHFDITKQRFRVVYGKVVTPGIGIPFEDFISSLYPEYREGCRKLFANISSGEQGKASALYRLKYDLSKSDIYLDCQMSALQGKNGKVESVVGTFKNVTANIENQKQQDLEQLKIDLVISSCGIVLWDYDVKNEKIYTHREGVIFKGIPMTVEEYLEYVHPDDRNKILEYVKPINDGSLGRFDFEVRVIVPGFENFQWVVISGIPYKRDETGRVIKYTGLRRNNTEWRKINEDVVVLRDKAQKSNALESMFLSNVSHEIRTPLNSIMGFSSMINSADNEQDRQMFIDAINVNSELLLNTLSDIVVYSKIESDTIKYSKSLVSIVGVCKEVFNTNISKVSPHINLILQSVNSDFIVEADRRRIVDVLSNIVNNAIKFTHEGSIEIGFQQYNDNSVEVFVSDTGIGIPRDKTNAVFDKFTKLDELTIGTGLGLPICKNIINHTGGTIGVESEEGVGSRFWFRLPFVDVVANELTETIIENKNVVLNDNNMEINEINPEQEPLKAESSKVVREKPLVLIAEDNESNYFLAYTILKKEYEISHAVNGVEAVDLVADTNPDLVLMDMKMPIMGGLEATRKIRESGVITPIIALTAHAFDSDRDQAIEAGCDDFITKPIDTAKLKEMLQKYISK